MGKLVFCLLIVASPPLLVLRMLPVRRSGDDPGKPSDCKRRNARGMRVKG